jgi:hypothetical protein
MVDLDQLDEAVDAVVGEDHGTVVVEAVDPDQAILGLHFDGDVEPEVEVLADVFGDAVDGPASTTRSVASKDGLSSGPDAPSERVAALHCGRHAASATAN